MPFSYISHLRSFLVIWLAAMPVLLVYYMSYWVGVPQAYRVGEIVYYMSH